MTHRYWPLFGLRLTSPDLALRLMAEADLAAIADLLPDDLEHDPAATTYAIGDGRAAARRSGLFLVADRGGVQRILMAAPVPVL